MQEPRDTGARVAYLRVLHYYHNIAALCTITIFILRFTFILVHSYVSKYIAVMRAFSSKFMKCVHSGKIMSTCSTTRLKAHDRFA
jgi:hypothetical protein